MITFLFRYIKQIVLIISKMIPYRDKYILHLYSNLVLIFYNYTSRIKNISLTIIKNRSLNHTTPFNISKSNEIHNGT